MKNKKLTFLLVIKLVAIFLLIVNIAKAQMVENPSTPEIFNEPGAKLLITEVNLKNKEMDFVELYYESPTGKPLNLKNFQFQDDSVFKKITQDYWISSKEHYLLQFKNTTPDNQQAKILTTSRTGLTSTTEQIIFKDPNGKTLDALCWANATPTSDEIKDMQELFESEGWVSANASSCFSSSKISTNQSLIRNGNFDSDSTNDWSVTDDITPGKSNISIPVPESPQVVIATEQTEENTELIQIETADTSSYNNDEPEELLTPEPAAPAKPTAPKKTSSTKTTTEKKTSTSKKSSSKKSTTPKLPKYKDGDISSDIIISEIYPRANKDDRSNEWIELTNIGDQDINLGNWQVDDAEGSSKPYTIPDTITVPAQRSVVIKASDSKISLANSKDTVRLFDHEGTLLQTIEYEEAPKDEAYSLIIVDKEDGSSGNGSTEEKWVWEKNYTMGEPNPHYLELSGTITQEAEFGESYHFALQTADQRELKIIFDESLIAGPLAKATFQKNAQIKILGIPDPENPMEFHLKQYEILTSPGTAPEDTSPWYLLGLLPPGGAGFWFGLKKIRRLSL